MSSFGLSAIGQIAITVTDVERAIAFYRDTLGMKLLFQVPNLGFFDCGGIRLMLSGTEKPGEHYSSVIYFRVGDLQEACRELAARGLVFEQEPHMIARMADHDLWMAFFRDPDRNLLGLMSEVKHP
jgi:methylmalonyl-CoA/ethylmalonyl-CoA epimerase